LKFIGILRFFVIAAAVFLAACSDVKVPTNTAAPTFDLAQKPLPEASASPSPDIPDLQTEITDERFRSSAAPICSFDFLNYTYELPRGWQNPDGTTSLTLKNGKTDPVGIDADETTPEKKAEVRQQRRIGLTHVSTKCFDATGDGEDEAVVVLKIETGGSAIPQVVYVFTWKDGKPEVIWPFRTGDRSDGGLKDIRPENGMLVIELYGQDRFLLGQTETGKITGDEVQLCCPTHFTRSRYKWNGKDFLMQGKRLTYLTADQSATPVENMGAIVNEQQSNKKK
jgi:hypothetical protein